MNNEDKPKQKVRIRKRPKLASKDGIKVDSAAGGEVVPKQMSFAEMTEQRMVPSLDARGLETILQAEGWDVRYNTRMDFHEYRKKGAAEHDEWTPIEKDGAWLGRLRSTCRKRWHFAKNKDEEGSLQPSHSQPKYIMGVQQSWDDVRDVAELVEVDPCMDWYKSIKIEGLKWDREECADILVKALADNFSGINVEDPYDRWFAAVMWTGMFARLNEPGCFARTFPVLVGNKKCGKTEFMLGILPKHLDEYVLERLELKTGKREFRLMVRGKLLIIADEMVGGRRAGEGRLKGLIADKVDTERDMRANAPGRQKRTFFLLGNANPKDKPIPVDEAMRDRLACKRVYRKPGLIGEKAAHGGLRKGGKRIVRDKPLTKAEREEIRRARHPMTRYMDDNRDKLAKAGKILYERYGWEAEFPEDEKALETRDEENARHVFFGNVQEHNDIADLELIEGYAVPLDLAAACGYHGVEKDEDGKWQWKGGQASSRPFCAALRDAGWIELTDRFVEYRNGGPLFTYGPEGSPEKLWRLSASEDRCELVECAPIRTVDEPDADSAVRAAVSGGKKRRKRK